MSKKHFVALAKGLKEVRPNAANESHEQWQRDCIMVAIVCEDANPRFDRARFLRACGVVIGDGN